MGSQSWVLPAVALTLDNDLRVTTWVYKLSLINQVLRKSIAFPQVAHVMNFAQ